MTSTKVMKKEDEEEHLASVQLTDPTPPEPLPLHSCPSSPPPSIPAPCLQLKVWRQVISCPVSS